ncbi:hypothetical protein GUITHDRAFT_160925 [Guillardia theta CCMP2712]|uniref:Uncharacterized protein n=1 Tax=Guillardia theta (strain CCMP2712) TaxID=905079 RepID=L1JZT5_GUITC|nr:hypothetical protein GUITHDRAFT_160925 [Guillardia theta CCMP2712]EKX53789.1 hypothetical protein GUITHDRAFT_160925 [Guillardia theta CCMP2712]|eukprot:XP_005840769.1 hypothetical protein GUITHDRAFT_160925 [Guillardia theta CCMP2712]
MDQNQTSSSNARKKSLWAAASLGLFVVALVGSHVALNRSDDIDEHFMLQNQHLSTLKSRALADQAQKMASMTSVSTGRQQSLASVKESRLGGVHSARYAALVEPNKNLVIMLEKKAKALKELGQDQLAKARDMMHLAHEAKKDASAEIKQAATMRLLEKQAKAEGKQVRVSFAKAEEPTLKANKEMKAADRAYRREALKLAGLIPKVNELKSEKKPVPASLLAEIKNVTAALKADKSQRARIAKELQQAASAQSSSYSNAQGNNPLNLELQRQEYEFDEESMRKYEISHFCQICQSLRVSHRASRGKKEMKEYKTDLDDSSSRKLDAQRLLDVSACLFKNADYYKFDADFVRDEDATYQQVLNHCGA